jgi:hypothetical protein
MRGCLILIFNRLRLRILRWVHFSWPRPWWLFCLLVDCTAIGDCRDTTCGDCVDEFHTFSNCALDESCYVVCIRPDDACYDELITANSRTESIQHANDCLLCGVAGQIDPSNPTCSGINFDAYEECLTEKKCEDCVDEYMSLFACQDEAAECDVTCTDTTSCRLKRTGNKPHHFHGHGMNRKGPRVNSPRTKSH